MTHFASKPNSNCLLLTLGKLEPSTDCALSNRAFPTGKQVAAQTLASDYYYCIWLPTLYSMDINLII